MFSNPGFRDAKNLNNLYHIFETIQNDLNLRFAIEELLDEDIAGFHDAIQIRFDLTKQMIRRNISMVPEAQNWPESNFEEELEYYTIQSIYPIYKDNFYAIYRIKEDSGLMQTLKQWFEYTNDAEKYLKCRPFAEFSRNGYWYFLAPNDEHKFAKQMLDLESDNALEYFTKFYSIDEPINKRSKKTYSAYEEYHAKIDTNSEKEG